MRREDWLWLLIKAAGLWLIVGAVEVMQSEAWSWFDHGQEPTAGREQLLRVAVPMAAGLVLMLVDFAKWLPVESSGDAPESRPIMALDRADWLWVGLKIVGAYSAMMVVLFVGQLLSFARDFSSIRWPEVLWPGCSLVIALWLLFGDKVWRVAVREERPSKGTVKVVHLRDVLFVIGVFALLALIPILVVMLVGGGKG